MAGGDYIDIRQDFWRAHFQSALSYGDYLAAADPVHQARWESYRGLVSLSEHDERIVRSFKRQMRVLVVSGVWCGDCARQGPIIDAIASVNRCVEVRFIDNQASPELRDEVRINGATRVPVVVCLSEDWFEVGRFGDRTLSAYRRKAEREAGVACDPGIVMTGADELAVEVREWVEIFERHQLLLRLAPALRRRHGD